MAGYDGRGARFPLTIVRGADMAIELTVTSGGSAVNLSAATIAGEVYNASGTLVDTMTAVVSGAGSNVATLSFTDAETTAFTGTRYSWTLWVTRGGDKRPWLAGQVNVTDGTTGQSGTSGSYALTVDGDLTVAVDVAAIGYDFATLDDRYAPLGGGWFSSAAQRAFRARLQAEAGPAVITLLGDSTGNDYTDWFRPVIQSFAAAYPEWTVVHRLWSDTNQGYLTADYRQVGTAGLAYLRPGTAGASTPDSAAKSLTSCDVMIRALISKDSVSAGDGERVIASHFGSGGNRSWRFHITSGALVFEYSVDGTTLISNTIASGVQMTAAGFTNAQQFYVGVQVTRDNGSSNARVEAITSTDGSTWTTFGTAITSGAVITSLFDSTQVVEVGSRGGATGPFTGSIYWVEAYKGLTSTSPVAWRFDASMYQTGTTFVDAEGSTWTTLTGATITRGAPLLLAMNGSHPGATISYAEDVTRQPLLLSAPSNMVILNWGHNQSETDVQSAYKALIDDVTTSEPSATIVLCRQNPQHSGAANYLRQNRHQSNVGELAARNGYGVIDGFQAFLDTGDPDTYVDVNDVHPTTAGYVLWSNVARRTFGLAEV